MNEPMTVEEFRLEILKSVFGGEENIQYYELTDEDWANIYKLSEERYQQWDWNYGQSPKFNLQRSQRFPSGSIDVRLEVKKGVMEEVHIFGDFFGVGDMADVEQALVGKNYERNVIEEALNAIDVPTYFGGVTKEQFIQLIY